MADDETGRELEKLRAEMSALADARREVASAPVETPPVAAAAVEESATADDTESSTANKTQFEELGDLLQAEIRDLPTITCLTVFSLGIIMGRLMR
jgi:hypothetical protein